MKEPITPSHRGCVGDVYNLLFDRAGSVQLSMVIREITYV